MHARIDHVVFCVEDQHRALAFYEQVVGLPGVRADEFRAEQVGFPSVPVSNESIIDLMLRDAAPLIDSMFGGDGAAGNRVSHLYLAMRREDMSRCGAGVAMSVPIQNSYGAPGAAPEAFYFLDPDGNVLEARAYD